MSGKSKRTKGRPARNPSLASLQFKQKFQRLFKENSLLNNEVSLALEELFGRVEKLEEKVRELEADTE